MHHDRPGAHREDHPVLPWWLGTLLALVVACACQPARPAVQPPPGSPDPRTPTGPALICGNGGHDCHLALFAVIPDDGVGPLVARFDAATTSIDYVPFELDQPRLLAALAAAQRRGVRVRVLLEPTPSEEPGLAARAIGALDAAGIEHRPTNPAFALTHAKYALVDGTQALILTFNAATSELTSRRDFGLTDDDPADVAFVQALFEADWQRGPTPAIPPGFVVSPENSNPALVNLVASAHATLEIYSEKLLPSPLLDAIVTAARRGVQVRLLSETLDPKERAIEALQRAGPGANLQVRVPRAPRIHAKVILVDHKLVFLGSENIQDAPRDRRRELGVVFAEPSIATRLLEIFERDWASPADTPI